MGLRSTVGPKAKNPTNANAVAEPVDLPGPQR